MIPKTYKKIYDDIYESNSGLYYRYNETEGLCFSKGNTKTGIALSLSTLPLITCPGSHKFKCGYLCYAVCDQVRSNELHRTLKLNTDFIMKYGKEELLHAFRRIFLWSDIEHVRFKVEGDVFKIDELDAYASIAAEYPTRQFLMFSKSYEILKLYFESHERPANFNVILSVTEYQDESIYGDISGKFPLAMMGDLANPGNRSVLHCPGFCVDCGYKCWTIGPENAVLFHLHGWGNCIDNMANINSTIIMGGNSND